jgi:phosphate-selective porin OprO/OprP
MVQMRSGWWLGVWMGFSSIGFANPTMGPVTGVIRFDQAMYKEQTSTELGAPANSANLRTFDIGSKVEFSPVTTFHWELNFANGVGLNPTFVTYEGISKNHILSFGYIPSPFCLENENSSKTLPFMERAMPVNAFSPCLGAGGMYHYWSPWMVLKASLTQPPYGMFNDSKVDKGRGDDRWGGTTRVIFVPMINDRQVFHLGGSFSFQDISPDQLDDTGNMKASLKFTSTPELRSRRTENFVSASIMNAARYYVGNAEIAGKWGPFQADAEYFQTRVKRHDQTDAKIASEDLNFSGWYAQANYFTGESREYKLKDAKFGGVEPTHTCGAWQIATRYSTLNLDNKDIQGGREDNVSVALSWYPSKQIRWMANYVRANVKQQAAFLPDNRVVDMMGLRLQLLW